MNLIVMNCPQCGAKLDIAKDMMFCPYCGSKIVMAQNEGTAPTNDLQLGLYYLLMGKYQPADDCFSRLLEKIPTSNVAWFWRAIIAVIRLDNTTAVQFWHQSAISKKDAVALLIQLFDKPGNPVIDYLIPISVDLATEPGGWDLFTVIMKVGEKLGKKDLVIKSFYSIVGKYKKCPTEYYEYILRLDASQHDVVIEDCLLQATFALSESEKEKAESFLNYIKKIAPNGERIAEKFWLIEEKKKEIYKKIDEGDIDFDDIDFDEIDDLIDHNRD